MGRITRQIFSVHSWCGLVAGVFILVMSLSGAILVFHDEIDASLIENDFLLAGPAPQVSIDKSFETIRRDYPGWDIRIPSLPATPYHPLKYEVRKGSSREWIFAHPETGKVMGKLKQAENRFIFLLLRLHFSFFAGTIGKGFVLLLGVLLLILIFTGTIVYRRSIASVLLFRQKIRIHRRRPFFSGLHRVLGVWALVFNLLISVTGIRLAYVVFKSSNLAERTFDVPEFSSSVDSLIRHVHCSYPDFVINYMRFPTSRTGTLSLLGRLRSDPFYYGKTYSNIQVDPATGRTSENFLKDKPMPDVLLTSLQALHFGDFAGMTGKIIYCLGGLVTGILSISGFIVWQLRPGARKRKIVGAPGGGLF